MDQIGGKMTRGREAAEGEAATANDEDRRIYVRFPFRGTAFPIRFGEFHSCVRLRDLSCGGAAGLSEMPLEIGDVVYIELDGKHVAAAEVRWVRRLSVGLRFVTPLEPMLVRKVHAERSKPQPLF